MKDNHFIHRISKETINTLPISGFEGEVVVVDRPEQISDAAAYLSSQPVLGVDTESRPSFTRGVHYPTALVQIASHERCYLFRLTHVGMPEELCALFANPAICKVGLAFKDNLNGLRRRRNFTPRNCIDLQSIAWQYGILDMSLQKLFAICYGQKISKSQQLTNWENSHLTPEQARYASTDAWATLLIYHELSLTRALPQEEALAIRRADQEAQLLHQQQVLAQRLAQKSHDDHSSQAQ